jgi:hypothetical protein
MPEGYAELQPSISSDKTYVLDNVPHLDPETGYPAAGVRSVRVRQGLYESFRSNP